MTNKENNVIDEGTIEFWINIEKNEQFANPNSNIRFMLNNDIGSGVLVTVLKEKEYLHVEINNPKYGYVDIKHNISKYLDKSMMVALTWQQISCKLYLNGELASEGTFSKGKGMINIKYPDEVMELFQFINVDTEQIRQTVNDRHRGFIMYGNPIRLGAIHWFDDKPIFVMGSITKTHQEGNNLKLEEITVSLILRLINDLPSGKISRNDEFQKILKVIATSFGLPVRCAKGQEPSMLHIDSDWDNTIEVENKEKDTFLIQGTFSPEKKKCSYVWAFSIDKYKKWFMSQFHSN